MILLSPSFKNGSRIPSKFTCDDKNVSPPLYWSNVPNEAKSLVLIMEDPDAPSGNWVHWIAYNISVKSRLVEGENLPSEGTNSWGGVGYRGPCPPKGIHRYIFTLYAIDKKLPDLKNPDKRKILTVIKNRIVADAELVGLYSK